MMDFDVENVGYIVVRGFLSQEVLSGVICRTLVNLPYRSMTLFCRYYSYSNQVWFYYIYWLSKRKLQL